MENYVLGSLTEIQQDIVNPHVEVSSILRKAQILAYRLNSDEFKSWVEMELHGYPTQGKNYDEHKALLAALPDYRQIQGTVCADISTRFWRNPQMHVLMGEELDKLPDELHIFYFDTGIPIIERLLKEAGNFVISHWPDFWVRFFLEKVAEPQGMICSGVWKQTPPNIVGNILETVRDRLLKFILELERIYPDFDNNQKSVSRDKISQILNITIHEVSKMSIFDQSNQNVQGNQYNAAGNINFGGVHNISEFAAELEKLQAELSRSAKAGELDEDTATDAQYELTKALQQAKKPQPDKGKILQHLENVKRVLKDIVAVAGAVVTLGKASEVLDAIL